MPAPKPDRSGRGRSTQTRSSDSAKSTGASVRRSFALTRRTLKDFADDECPRMAAALSYYTVFSLPPLLVLILMVTGVFVDQATIEGRIQSEIATTLGPEGARQVREIIAVAEQPGSGGRVATILSILALLFGATGAFAELQKALNRAWEVEADPRQGGLLRFFVKRLLSLGMAVTIAFLLLVSLLLSALLSAFGDEVAEVIPGGLSGVFLQVVQLTVSFAVVTLLFALMFKVLPDARSRWRDVWVGALGTAVLFTVGKFALGLYLSRSDPGEAFGAAGSLAVLLVWVYYSAMIVFLGAEFTQHWAVERGAGIVPKKGAIRLMQDTPKRAVRRA
jgi:membrane protein